MSLSEKIDKNSYTKIIILATIGNYIVELLPLNDGYIFSKEALSLCWDWIEEKIDNIEDIYDCLCSEDEIDFVYYEEMADDEQKIIYRILFCILAYIANEIAIIKNMSTPQYLDLCDEYFFNSIVKLPSDKYEYIKETVKHLKVLEYSMKS